jgi:hypothetical protein
MKLKLLMAIFRKKILNEIKESNRIIKKFRIAKVNF